MGDLAIMRRIDFISLTVLAAAFAFAACSDTTTNENENTDLPYAPSDCKGTEPATGPFRVVVTINNQFKSVPITIYRGDIEDRVIEIQDTLLTPSTTFDLDTNESFAALALYIIGPDTVGVLGSDEIEAFNKEYRDRYCWQIMNGDVDLRLRLRP